MVWPVLAKLIQCEGSVVQNVETVADASITPLPNAVDTHKLLNITEVTMEHLLLRSIRNTPALCSEIFQRLNSVNRALASSKVCSHSGSSDLILDRSSIHAFLIFSYKSVELMH